MPALQQGTAAPCIPDVFSSPPEVSEGVRMHARPRKGVVDSPPSQQRRRNLKGKKAMKVEKKRNEAGKKASQFFF